MNAITLKSSCDSVGPELCNCGKCDVLSGHLLNSLCFQSSVERSCNECVFCVSLQYALLAVMGAYVLLKRES